MTPGLSKFEEVRVAKLAELAALGVDPWGQRFDGRQPLPEVAALAPAELGSTSDTRVRVAGRVVGLRDSGKVLFVDLQDQTGRVQLFIGQKQVGAAWEWLRKVDLWDHLGAEGKIGRTKAGEPTVFVDQCWFLGKTIAHPPGVYYKAEDQELLLRRRYIDMTQNPEVVRRFEARSRLLRTLRDFLHGRGFMEVETPTMQAIAGGAAARPFVTHHNALDLQLYLRIAPELYLKRLLVGGLERVFEIARVFRNEGIDATHNPEFTMMELYEAYGSYDTMMELTEGLVVALCDALGSRQRPWKDRVVDYSPPWQRRTYDSLLREHAGAGLGDEPALQAAAAKHGIDTKGKHPDVLAQELFERCVEDHLAGPVFVTDYPATVCPLTKRKAGAPHLAERFELFVDGMELANAYTELNDPLLQEELFRSQLGGLKEEDSMAKMDVEFVDALKHGMPPAGGLGIGIDRLAMLLTNSQTIRDVIVFPLLRPQLQRPGGGPEGDEENAGTEAGSAG